jgi:hypothetical protein
MENGNMEMPFFVSNSADSVYLEFDGTASIASMMLLKVKRNKSILEYLHKDSQEKYKYVKI